MKKICRSLVVGLTLLTAAIPVHAEQSQTEMDVYQASIQFIIDGKSYLPHDNQFPFIYEGSTYVPLRFVAYSLGKAVKWDGSTYTVYIDEPKAEDQLEIELYNTESAMNAQMAGQPALEIVPQSILVYMEEVNYFFNTVPKHPPDGLPGIIYQDSLYVPIRFISESMGRTIQWDPKTYTITAVTTKEVKPSENPIPTPPLDAPNASVGSPGTGVSGGSTGSPGSGVPSGSPGGGVVKPSQESLINAAKTQMEALQNRCTSELTDLYTQYFSATDIAVRNSLKSSGQAKINACIAQYNSYKNSLESQLINNGYSTDVISEIEDKYNELFELMQQYMNSSKGI